MARPTSSKQSVPSTSTVPAARTVTTTITIDTASSSNEQQPQVVDSLVLKLKRPQKKVSWKKGTVDNEFMNKKSSKRCCIFHKEKPFDEDDSDAEGDCDHDHHAHHSERNSAGKDTTVEEKQAAATLHDR